MPTRNINPATVPPPLGLHSQAVLTSGAGRFLHIAGQIGMRLDGSTPRDFASQADAIWRNICAILEEVGMSASNLIKVVTYVTDASQVGELNPVRVKYLGDTRPASTLIVVKALLKPEWLIEVDAVAFAQ
ncbi:RidA family protein [Mesorhizobium sp. CO1-1-8]|uniref:RidA family protein n=1 Tax=Mesorhizobium sp. CO1-1-8 TaxID=2876631 RepID=UPI001CD17E24|nr:RidA family protein [Mesorhizobium sp. CO1-1-8]MBZ9772244.1 RidA family protein [Mesorhizobium sp. CO1-1-8]